MKCPVDDTVLVMSERQGVEIDYCPSCRGVWLDRGELDKILDRAAEQEDRAPPRRGDDDDARSNDYQSHESVDRRPKKKKTSFLSEMFEFGG